MKVYEGKDIRNIGVVGHGDCGKTSLVAGFLFTGGATSRLTRVDEGNTITDFDEEEQARKISISSALACLEWGKSKLNLIDTPGYNIFIHDAKTALIAADAALVVVDSVAGVEVQTEKVWAYADEFRLPRAIVVNKLDRERASFERALASIQEIFGRTAVPVQLPIGEEREFRGVIDLVAMKAYTYQPDGNGKGTEAGIPAALADAAQKAHEALIEMVAEGNDALMEEYFDKGALAPDHLVAGLREAVRERRLAPILCASGLHNVGSDLLLNFLEAYMPSPVDRGVVEAKGAGGAETARKVSDAEPLSLFVFKTVADPFAGRVTYFKVYSGVLKNDANVYNYTRSAAERLSHIGVLFGKTIMPVTEIHAGDIGAVAKLKETLTGDSLGDKASPVQYPAVVLPVPAIAYALEPKSRQDEDRMSAAIHRILEEDQSLRFYRDPQTKEFLLAGSGQQHIEVIVSRLKKRYGVEVTLKAPKIPYRETIRGRADVQGRHKKQTGGHGQFGDCKIKMEPLPRGGAFEFVNDIFGGAIPKTFIPAVEKGVLEAAERGYLAGYPVVDFRVVLYDGSYHEVDSSEMAFKLAGRKAFRAAMEQAKPALLEPIMNVEIHSPMEYSGDLMGDLNSRRGRIAGMDTKGNTQIIKAQVPMAEMLSYANELTSMTQGRASYTMEFSHYDFVPAPIADKVITAARAARTGEEEEEE
ncbi:MAG TPA: elongation factor G [Bryobacterales bacterium]|nr:elongation factor G [Bryobacterales bacterium]